MGEEENARPRAEEDELHRFASLLSEAQVVERPAPGSAAAAATRKRWLRRIALAVAIPIVATTVGAGGYAAWALNAPLPEPTPGRVTAPAVPVTSAVDDLLPSRGSSAISVAGAEEFFGVSGDEIWMTAGDQGQRPIASITKLITALVVLDAQPIGAGENGPTITFGASDRALYDRYYVQNATVAPMPRGTALSLRDALATVLIPSASNYATAVARWAYGSEAAFVRAAGEWLDEHGLDDTTVVEPTGIDPRNRSTPADLIELGRLSAAHPVVADLAGTRRTEVEGPGVLINTNDLLGVDGATGLKTGTLSDSGSNLIYTATLDVGLEQSLQVVGVLLGGDTRSSVAGASSRVLSSLRAGFQQVTPAQTGQVLTTYTTPWGDSVEVALGTVPSLLVWGDTPIEADIDLSTPVNFVDGEEVGSITWTAGERTVSAPLRVVGSITDPGEKWRLQNPRALLAGDR
ncbi:D-alanyl-D-alanine carboxypeptidase family protein [Microbacterium sp.]|uniref:D-alanyl-D-alanine carboxypeptidase family protein n=1 Tax=Microbacterium sp. TaxID=51671 RepID=UPI0037366394